MKNEQFIINHKLLIFGISLLLVGLALFIAGLCLIENGLWFLSFIAIAFLPAGIILSLAQLFKPFMKKTKERNMTLLKEMKQELSFDNGTTNHSETCPSCGRRNAPNSKFCAECGTPLVKVCPDCGAELNADSNFCNVCGRKVE